MTTDPATRRLTPAAAIDFLLKATCPVRPGRLLLNLALLFTYLGLGLAYGQYSTTCAVVGAIVLGRLATYELAAQWQLWHSEPRRRSLLSAADMMLPSMGRRVFLDVVLGVGIFFACGAHTAPVWYALMGSFAVRVIVDERLHARAAAEARSA